MSRSRGDRHFCSEWCECYFWESPFNPYGVCGTSILYRVGYNSDRRFVRRDLIGKSAHRCTHLSAIMATGGFWQTTLTGKSAHPLAALSAIIAVRGGRRCYFLRFAPSNVPEACKVLSKSLIFRAALDPSWPSRAEAWKIPFRTPVPNVSISYIFPL